jgi:hypothetical protein
MATSPYTPTSIRQAENKRTTTKTTQYPSRDTYAYGYNIYNDRNSPEIIWPEYNPSSGYRGRERIELPSAFNPPGVPPGSPYSPSGGSRGGGGGGGGGGGAPPVDATSILALLNRKPSQYQWQNQEFNPYVGPEFYNFDQGIYDRAKAGLGEAISADRASGNAAFNRLGTEMAQYQNPWSNPTTIQTPTMSAAMQRMMQANNVATDTNQADINQGVQADQAFGNLGSMLGLIAQQEQEARQRANQGYQQGFNERLDAEQRGGTLSVDMQMAAARRQYDQDKWTYGESVARKNYDTNLANIQYNNQGQNQVSQANTQAANEWQSNSVQTLIDLIASGAAIDPAMLAQIGA